MYINCNGKLLDFETPRVMGILNLTPDSFYDGGRKTTQGDFLSHAEKMLLEGADIIDVGAYSSRPGAKDISLHEELGRIVPVVEALRREFPEVILSIDTFRSEVARRCVEAGGAIINDISGGTLDAEMLPTVAELQVPYILMHMRGTPKNMNQFTSYDNLVKDILFYFSQRIKEARDLGINDLIIDPGFGFSKTLEQNYELMGKLDLFHSLELPILSGISRKSMIYKLFDTTPDHALNGTTILNTVSLLKGAHILRVHDVKEAVECVKMVDLMIV